MGAIKAKASPKKVRRLKAGRKPTARRKASRKRVSS
jgi:hypothetical protein